MTWQLIKYPSHDTRRATPYFQPTYTKRCQLWQWSYKVPIMTMKLLIFQEITLFLRWLIWYKMLILYIRNHMGETNHHIGGHSNPTYWEYFSFISWPSCQNSSKCLVNCVHYSRLRRRFGLPSNEESPVVKWLFLNLRKGSTTMC